MDNSRPLFFVTKSWHGQLKMEYDESIRGIMKMSTKHTCILDKVISLIKKNDTKTIHILINSYMIFPWKRVAMYIRSERMANILAIATGAKGYNWMTNKVMDGSYDIEASKVPSLPGWIRMISFDDPIPTLTRAMYRDDIESARKILLIPLTVSTLKKNMKQILREPERNQNQILLIHYLLDMVASREMKDEFLLRGINALPMSPHSEYLPEKHECIYRLPDMKMETLINHDRADLLMEGYGMKPGETIEGFLQRIKAYVGKPLALCINKDLVGYYPYVNSWLKSIHI